MKRWYVVQSPEGDPAGAPPAGDPPPAPKTIPLDVLPPEMQDMSEAEIKFFLSKTLSGVKDTNETNRQLQTRLEMLEQQLSQPKPEPKEPDPDDDKPLSELIIENPEKAIERVAIAKGWISGMQTIASQAGDALFDTIAAKIDGFEEHEDDVRKLLKETGAPVNRDSIARAFEMVVGRKALEERSRSQRKAAGADPAPKPAAPKPADDDYQETDFEKEIREAAGKTKEQWKALKSESFEIKVPVSPR